MRRIAIITLLSVLPFTGCTVKEDRQNCPCYLQVDLKDAYDGIEGKSGDVLVSIYCPETVYRSSVLISNYPDYLEIPVPKGEIMISVLSEPERQEMQDKSLLISEGNQADSVYAYCTNILAEGEFIYDRITLHKQYSTVFLKLSGPPVPPDGEVSPVNLDLKIIGYTDGLHTNGLKPHEGTFSIYLPAKTPEEVQTFRIPRQADKSLKMELYERSTGKLVDTIPLGEYIDATGYSWTAIDLQDIYIELDYAMAEVRVSINEWEDGMNFSLEI